MIFTAPFALLLLILLPIVLFIGFPRIAYRRGRDGVSLFLRVVILLLLIGSLAGVQAARGADTLAVVYLMDTSDSVGQDANSAQIAYIRDSLTAMNADDRAAVVVFAGDALVERTMNARDIVGRDFGTIRSAPNTGNSDLEEAIGLALALFPGEAAKRIVVLSDGEQTVGDAEIAARRAAATGVEISYVPFSRAAAPEVQVSDVRVPASVSAGQTFDLGVTVESEVDTPAALTVFAEGRIVYTQSVDLREGDNRYALTLTAGEGGFADFRVQVTPQTGDAFYQNNTLSAFSRIVGPPRVLLVATDPAETQYLAEGLRQQGLTVDEVRPTGMPNDVAGLETYETVVLANVPATELSRRRMETLQTWVRDLGGGLVVSGGPNAYAPGGYFQTPLEETLPVEMQIRDQQRLPQLTITYVIDRSGSMMDVGDSGVTNLELAKEAIIRSIEFLQPTDRAGVVSFDTNGYWVADVQPVLDRYALQTLVATLQSGGGTDILAGMELAAAALRTDPSERKHIILLTDGGADEMGLVDLTRQLYEENGVTTSVIGIGDQAAPFLAQMAAAGDGNYHPVTIVENIPTIFAQETVLATRSYILEQPFTPSISGNSPILNGIAAAPPLLGYVASTARQTAQIILRGPEPYRDPILAQWQYGLGRAVAFTSDATARWGSNWVAWTDFARFWSQAVRWTITEGVSDNLETQIVMDGETARVTVDARGDDGAFLNGLTLDASIVAPGNGAQSLPLQQVAPGQYEGEFTPQGEGSYFVNVAGTGGENPYSQTIGWVMSYSPEYAIRPGNSAALLETLAGLTGGRSFAGAPREVFTHNLSANTAYQPLAPFLLLVALLILPFDIAVRRLLVTRSDLSRARAAIGERFAPRGASAETLERMTSLRDAKARAGARTTSEMPVSPSVERAPLPTPNPTSTAAALRNRRVVREETSSDDRPVPVAASPTPTSRPVPAAAPEPSPMPVEGETDGAAAGALASQLLKKRRERGGSA